MIAIYPGEIYTMALITVRGRVSKTPLPETTKTSKSFASASLAENITNKLTDERTTTWYDLGAWSPQAIRQLTAVNPKQYIEVKGYVKAKAFTKKNGEAGAQMAVSILSIEVLPDTRSANTTPTASSLDSIEDAPEPEIAF
jgi:hypothetical protein